MKRNFDYSVLMGEGNPLLRFPRLLDAAIDEFSMKKYEDASLNDILKNSGFSKGSLYHHFGDKFGLYLAMMDIAAKKKLSYFYPALRRKVESNSDFFSSLKEIMKETMNFMLEDKRLYHLFNRMMEESDEFRSRLYSFLYMIMPDDYIRYFSDFVCQAVQSGQIDSRYPPGFVAWILEIMFTNLHKLISAGDPDELINLANQVVDVIQHGISGNPGK
ncbi:MAG: TetR/AcrR family transcriptional regulator [Clostridiaceae bacterium]|nr:TetR/AcrR family transcriptional regulator [Clostridiaceae bacterium]